MCQFMKNKACTVVLHSGLCPYHTLPHHHCHVPSWTNPPEIVPRSYRLLHPPALTRKEAVLLGSLVKSNATGTWTSLNFCQKTLLAQWVMETWISPSPEVKNTHFTTEPDCVVTFQSLVIFMKQHCTSEAFLVLVFGLHFSTSHIVQYCQKILLKKTASVVSDIWQVCGPSHSFTFLTTYTSCLPNCTLGSIAFWLLSD